MKNFWKNLTSRLAGKTSHVQPPKGMVGTRSRASAPLQKDAEAEALRSTNKDAGPAAAPSPGGEGRGEGELNNSGRQSAQIPEPQRGSSIQPGVAPKTFGATLGSRPNNPINPERVESKPSASQNASEPHEHEPSPFDNLGYNRNGKIAHLPRALRDRINHALYNRCPAKHLVLALNPMPEVKAVLAQYFNGRPIKQQNISEWKQGGYRDWLHHRRLLEQKRELTADAKDLSDTAHGMADSLFGMLTLDYADLMMNGDKETPEEFEKRRKKLSLVSHDIARMHRCHINTRRVEVQEARLERDEEKTEEQLVFKFMEWTENPAVRRACILEPMEKDRQMRRHFDMPPRPEDPLVERLTQNDPYFNPPHKKQNKYKPKPTEKTSDPDKTPDVQSQQDTVGTRSSASAADQEVSPATFQGEDEFESQSEPQGGSSIQPGVGASAPTLGSRLNDPINPEGVESKPAISSPTSDYAGKTTSQIIAEIEEQHAREKAARLNAVAKKQSDAQQLKDPVGPRSCAAVGDKGELNSTSPARLPGASAWDSFSEPVHYAPPVYPSQHDAYNFKLGSG